MERERGGGINEKNVDVRIVAEAEIIDEAPYLVGFKTICEHQSVFGRLVYVKTHLSCEMVTVNVPYKKIDSKYTNQILNFSFDICV